MPTCDFCGRKAGKCIPSNQFIPRSISPWWTCVMVTTPTAPIVRCLCTTSEVCIEKLLEAGKGKRALSLSAFGLSEFKGKAWVQRRHVKILPATYQPHTCVCHHSCSVSTAHGKAGPPPGSPALPMVVCLPNRSLLAGSCDQNHPPGVPTASRAASLQSCCKRWTYHWEGAL